MTKKEKHIEVSLQEGGQKEILEVPEKIGFGKGDCYLISETLDSKISYSKLGKGAGEELAFFFEEIKQKDPEAKLESQEGKIVIALSKDFEVKTFRSPRRKVEMNEREKRKLDRYITAMIDSMEYDDKEDLDEEKTEKLKAEFPTVVKYVTDDENEDFYIKGDKEIWVTADSFYNGSGLLSALTTFHFKKKFNLERGTLEYLEHFEAVLSYVL